MSSEMLEIKEVDIEKRGVTYRHWVAIRIDRESKGIVAESSPIRWPSVDEFKGWRGRIDFTRYEKEKEKFYSQYRDSRKKLVNELLAKGWEPLGTDAKGEIVIMERWG